MALTISVARKNAGLDSLLDALNTGFFRIYSGTRPTNPDTALSGNTLLAELTFGATAFAAATGSSTFVEGDPVVVAAVAPSPTCAATLTERFVATVASTYPVATCAAQVKETFTCSAAATIPVATSSANLVEGDAMVVSATVPAATCAASLLGRNVASVVTSTIAPTCAALLTESDATHVVTAVPFFTMAALFHADAGPVAPPPTANFGGVSMRVMTLHEVTQRLGLGRRIPRRG